MCGLQVVGRVRIGQLRVQQRPCTDTVSYVSDFKFTGDAKFKCYGDDRGG